MRRGSETVPTRLTEGQERSSTHVIDHQKVQAAERAMNNERVPPGYRNSVRQYLSQWSSVWNKR